MKNNFFTRLRPEFPEGTFLDSPEDLAHYGTDWTRVPGQAGLVALPRTTADVAKILRACHEANQPVVPSGGRTGLAGGAVATRGELVLSTTRLTRLGTVDTLGRTLRAGAGATTQSVHETCAPHGLFWPIDLAAKGTSTIGGNLNTNAGGVRVIRYGMTRKWVTGVEAVTMAGDVVTLNSGLEKNNTGYDLLQLLVGSEGTLAVITEATLKLTRLARDERVLLFAVPDLAAMANLLELARSGPFDIVAFEFFSRRCLDTVEAKLGRRCRLSARTDYYVLMEVEPVFSCHGGESLDEWLAATLEVGVVSDGQLAQSSAERRELWSLREGITESIAMTGKVRKHDLCVPVAAMSEFLAEAKRLFDDDRWAFELYLFGHFGDGSPHFNFVQRAGVPEDVFRASWAAADEEVIALLARFGGSVSAEHGVGMLKKDFAARARTPTELALQRAIKHAFDPKGLLNPGKVV